MRVRLSQASHIYFFKHWLCVCVSDYFLIKKFACRHRLRTLFNCMTPGNTHTHTHNSICCAAAFVICWRFFVLAGVKIGLTTALACPGAPCTHSSTYRSTDPSNIIINKSNFAHIFKLLTTVEQICVCVSLNHSQSCDELIDGCV